MRSLQLIKILSVATALATLVGCVPYSTGPTEVGVRTIKFSLFKEKGVEDRVYEPGSTYFFVPIINDWHTFDTRHQILEMTKSIDTGDRRTRDDLIFKTIDGNDIELDVVFTYNIIPEMAPMILQEVAVDDQALRDIVVRSICRSRPRDIFGELRTEEFYKSQQRSQKEEEVLAELNRLLNPKGVRVSIVDTRDYRFNPAYQKAIEGKKIADQMAEKHKSDVEAKRQEWISELNKAVGLYNEMVAKVDGEFKQATIQADAYFEQQRMTSEAIEAEGIAEAEWIAKKREALVGSGGDTMVKLAIAEALKGKRIILLPTGGGFDIKTTDVNDLIKMYGVRSLTGK